MNELTFGRVVACAAATLFAAAAAGAEPLNAKPGAWEMTVTTSGTGNVIPPEALAKMPPERRAMVEKMMAERGGKPNTSVHKSCVKKEDLERDRFAEGNDDSACTRKTVSRTATKVVVAMSCSGTPPRRGTFIFEAKNPETVVGTIDQETGNGKFHVDVNGKWLGASCEGIADRPVKMN
ncbi:MAG: DUF3617 domain-containing protein [Burkholderiaceae bacterium]